MTRGILAILGLAALGVGLLHPWFRDPDGRFHSGLVVAGAAAAGFALLAVARRDLRPAAGWVALALIGAATSTQLIEAGRGVRYQHFVPWSELASRPWAAGVLLVQALVVAGFASWRLGPSVLRGVRGLGLIRTTMLGGVLVAAAAVVSRDLTRYVGEVLMAGGLRLVQLGTVGLAVAALPAATRSTIGDWATRTFGPVDPAETPAPTDARLAWTLAVGATIVTILLNVVVYQSHPHVPDEVHYLWQARYFSHGLLSLPVPPVPRAFDIYLSASDAVGWYSVVAPGWPAVLAIGARLGASAWVNPLLTGVNILLLNRVLGELLSPRTTRISLVLFAAAPWNLFLGMSYMPHAVTITLLLLAAWGVMRSRTSGAARWAWLAGAALGWLAIVRQLDAMIAAGALGLWAIGLGGRRLRWGSVVGLIVGSMAVAALVLPYNRHFTGSPTRFPIMVYNDARFGAGANDYGFGSNRGMGWVLDPNPGHDPIDGLINTNLNLAATEVDLFGWATGSLLLLGFGLVIGAWTRTDRLMVGLIVITWLAYFLNYFSGGPDFGARYWYPMVVPLVVLTARGVAKLGGFIETIADRPSKVAAEGASVASVGLLILVASIVFIPWRSIDKYYQFRGMRPDVRALAEERDFGRSLVLINGNEVPDFASAFVFNPVDFTADAPIFAWNRDSTVAAELRRAYPDRATWIVDGPSRTNAGFKVVAGPVAPEAPLP